MLHRLWPHLSRLGTNLSMQRLRYSSISFIWMLLQSLGVYPEAPCLRHLMPRASWMTNWSQLAYTNRMGNFRVEQENWMKMHFQCYSLVRTPEHSLLGGTSSTLEIVIRIWIGLGSSLSSLTVVVLSPSFKSVFSALANISPRYFPLSSMESCLLTSGSKKIPESATPYTTFWSRINDLKQSTHRQVAMPPADDPLTTILSACANLYLLSAHLMWERVLMAPLKYNWVSLYWMGDLLLPWWKDPSQYMITIFVQFANLDLEGSTANIPPSAPSQVSGQTLEVPNSPLLRLQQDYRVEDRSVPMQAPPPMKQKRMFLVSPPSWRQIMGLLPSRHLASGSVLWMSFLYGSALMAQTRRPNSIRVKNVLI